MASKITKVSTTAEKADRISQFSDDILCQILSFMSTKDSVRTRVLSTRWKHLFSLVPVLHFDYTPIHETHMFNDKEYITRFLDFVSWVFKSYNVDQMDTICFSSLQFLPQASRLLSYISESIRLGVRKIEIKLASSQILMLPCCISTCKTLSVLSLRGPFTLDVPENICLPCLKTISMVNISFGGVDSSRRLFQCCPVLEDLYIECESKYNYPGYTQVLEISLPSLKFLTIIRGYEDKFHLVLNIPNVQNFVYIGGKLRHASYSVEGLKSSAKARIRLHGDYHEALEKFVGAVCHIQDLSLHGYIFKAFNRPGGSFPRFFNLNRLEIGDFSCSYSKWILDLLEMTPCLQVLVVDNVRYFPDSLENDHHVHHKRVPACVSLHLKKIELKGFRTLKFEFKMVEFFLKNAKSLEMLKIVVAINLGSMEKQLEMRNKLMSFIRCSRACEIVLVSAIGEAVFVLPSCL